MYRKVWIESANPNLSDYAWLNEAEFQLEMEENGEPEVVAELPEYIVDYYKSENDEEFSLHDFLEYAHRLCDKILAKGEYVSGEMFDRLAEEHRNKLAEAYRACGQIYKI